MLMLHVKFVVKKVYFKLRCKTQLVFFKFLEYNLS